MEVLRLIISLSPSFENMTKKRGKNNRRNDNHGSAEVLAVLLPAVGCSSYLTLLPVVRILKGVTS
jgi:hypothetical protein